MTILFLILIVLASAILGFLILVQNPKGGGLSGSVGGFSNQIMGVKQTTDVLEKGTWVFSTIIAVLCLISSLFMSGGTTQKNSVLDQVPTGNTVIPKATQPIAPAPAVDSPAKP